MRVGFALSPARMAVVADLAALPDLGEASLVAALMTNHHHDHIYVRAATPPLPPPRFPLLFPTA